MSNADRNLEIYNMHISSNITPKDRSPVRPAPSENTSKSVRSYSISARAAAERRRTDRLGRAIISASTIRSQWSTSVARNIRRLSHPLIFSRVKMQLEVGVLMRRVSYDESGSTSSGLEIAE